MYTQIYNSPLGKILIAANEAEICGIWFYGQKHFAAGLSSNNTNMKTAVINNAIEWLDIYFSGKKPDFMPKIHLNGTSFQREVWNILLEIPYGQITTYGMIAQKIALRHGLCKMSAQAVGNAVSRNRISMIVPCHRVLGCNYKLTGYAGGIDKKLALLKLEGTDIKAQA